MIVTENTCSTFLSKLVNNDAQITYFCFMLPVISGLCDDKWQHWLGVSVARARVCGWDLARADSSAFNGQNKFAARWFCECFPVMEPRRRKHCSPSALWCVFVLWTQLQLTLTEGKSFKTESLLWSSHIYCCVCLSLAIVWAQHCAGPSYSKCPGVNSALCS